MKIEFINDVSKSTRYVDRNGKVKRDRDYGRWYSLRSRYDVCSEWRTRSVFESWLSEQLNKFPEDMLPSNKPEVALPSGYHLNQNILGRNTKVCSPDTYAIIPNYLWWPLKPQSGSEIGLPVGVMRNTQGEGYYSRLFKENLSAPYRYFKDPMKAHQYWQALKVDHLIEVIKRYFDDPSYDGRVMKVMLDLAEKIAQDISEGRETKQPLLDNLSGEEK